MLFLKTHFTRQPEYAGGHMKTLSSFGIAAALGLALSQTLLQGQAAAQEAGWTGNANFLLGAKALDKDEWEPAEEQAEFGAEVDFRRRDWPVSIAVDLLGAAGEGRVYTSFGEAKFESETSELSVGVRKVWDASPRVRPYIGGGLMLAKATARVSLLGLTLEDSDNGTGYWLGGGIYWTLSGSFNIGMEFRSSSAKAKLFDQEIKAGGGHFGLLLGYHWGGRAGGGEAGKPAAPENGPRPEPSYDGHESEKLDLERQKLEVERQKLQLEKEKFELEKRRSGQD